ncbi:hypothetical protein ALC60_06246 [Trachymyrmex zeteki]|uniref:Uncharacterized protein n=1 Tax=Mycetomoellerius zeteki TaxID=64791 RepID=A0A151X3B4_9HYME|nr:hypothetical protein ALC60_06246 [Trachymyrmex zeteki]
MQRKHSLRLVTLRDSRIKFGIGATRHGYIFRQGGPAMPRKAHAEYSFVLSCSKGRATVLDGACLRNERLNQIKRCGFWTRTVHSSERVYIRCVKTRQTLIASAKKMRIHCQSTERTVGSNPLIEEFYKKDTEGCVKTRYKSYDFIVDDCPPLRRAFVSSRKKWNAANYASITLISEIILRSPAEINFNGPTFCN